MPKLQHAERADWALGDRKSIPSPSLDHEILQLPAEHGPLRGGSSQPLTPHYMMLQTDYCERERERERERDRETERQREREREITPQ